MEPGLLLFCSLVGLVGLGVLWFRVIRPAMEDFGLLSYGSLTPGETVSHSDHHHPSAYVDDGDERPATRGVFRGQNHETENQGEIEMPRNDPPAPPKIDIKLVRDEERAYALGAVFALGLMKDDTRTKAIKGVFGDVTGARYSTLARAVRRHEEAIKATLPPAEVQAEEEARIIPIAGGKQGYVEM